MTHHDTGGARYPVPTVVPWVRCPHHMAGRRDDMSIMPVHRPTIRYACGASRSPMSDMRRGGDDMATMTLADAVHAVRRDGKPRDVQCSAHEDARASLSVSVADDGKILLCCHAGCATEAVLQSAGLTWADVMPPPNQKSRREIVARYDYTDEHGALLYQVVRFEPKDFRQRQPDGDGGWTWKVKGVRRVLYRLPELHGCTVAYIPEGERDVHSLVDIGLPATCNAGGAGKWRADYTQQLRDAGVRKVVVLPDNDQPGRDHANDVARSCHSAGMEVKIIELPGLNAKGDVADWIAAGHTREDLATLVKATPLYLPDTDTTVQPPELTDAGNAQRFADQHGKDVCYVPEWGWMVWDGTIWARDELAARKKMLDTARRIYREAETASEADQKQIAAWARQSQQAQRLSAALWCAQPSLAVRADEFDKELWLLPVENGTADLRTGKKHPPNREHKLTRASRVLYDSTAQCPVWVQFLARVLPDTALRDFVQRAVGYSLTGLTTEQCLFFLYGHGRNGKSVFLECLAALMGALHAATRIDSLSVTRGGGIPNDIAALAGARLVTVSETPENARLNEPLVKDLTGGDTISARFLRHEFFEYRPQFKLWIRGNHKPAIRGTDDGIWRRVMLVPFDVQIPEAEVDPDLPGKLRGELPGILNWAVEGCLAWQQQGLRPPQSVREAVSGYRDEMDTLGQFLDECCVIDAKAITKAKDLYACYVAWSERTGEKAVTQTRFGTALGERGFNKDKSGVISWQGVRLKSGQLDSSDPSRSSAQSRARNDGNADIRSELSTPSAKHEKVRL